MNIHDAFMRAASQLVDAVHSLTVGQVPGTTRLAIEALEIVLQALLEERTRTDKKYGSQMHRLRFDLGRELLGLSQGQVERLQARRHIDVYQNKKVGGPPATLSEEVVLATVLEVR